MNSLRHLEIPVSIEFIKAAVLEKMQQFSFISDQDDVEKLEFKSPWNETDKGTMLVSLAFKEGEEVSSNTLNNGKS